MRKQIKRFSATFLSVMMGFSMFTGYVAPSKTVAEAATVAAVESTTSNDYGLLDNACDGVILHCWNWSYSNIKDSMKEIAEAGYTSLQTSPVQMPKDASSSDTQTTWWKVYQPTTLSMPETHPWFGTKAEFKAMCDEAEKYGIKVIVDVVANHMANVDGKHGNCAADICSQNDSTFRDDTSCWHLNNSTGIDYSNQHRTNDATSLTYGFGGWPDLNTGSDKVQNAIISLLKECVDLGADGFRFDAAKHIELPTDSSGASDFWPNVTSAIKKYDPDVYLYGEILDDCATSISNYTKYIAVTDNRAGNSIRWGVYENNITKASSSALNYSGENADNIVLWAESHDTYANDNFTGESTTQNQAQVNRAWCIVAARDFAALYYVRPGSTSALMGSKSTNTAWKDAEVVATNKFHNYFTGTKEYMSSSGNVAIVERASSTDTSKCGGVFVNIGGGSATVSNATANLMKDGTYTDQITGNTFTVSGGKISGQIGSTGVAVVYNPEVVKTPSLTANPGSESFSSDTLTVKLSLSNATSGTYKLGSAAAKTITASTSITIGADMAVGDSVTLTTTATDGSETTTNTYTYTKTEQTSNVAYLSLPSGWSTPVYCYAYDSATEKVNNGTWPGVEMTYDSATGYYKYEIPDTIESPRVIFYSSATNRYPADMEKGLLFDTDGSWLYKDGSWSKVSVETKGTVIAKYVDESGNTIADSVTTTGKVGASYTTSAKTISGYTLKSTPSNATGTYTSGTTTVTYTYKEVTEPTVVSSLATGSSFKTETQTITLSLKNATSGTYSVDNGPVKTFTSATSVVLGQGKVADSTVTVTTTAKDSSGNVTNQTFTYKKVFNGTVNETATTALATTTATSTSSTPSTTYYKANANGYGAKKTITVDGSASDWDSSMLIYQSAAWDTAVHWKGTHENCVLDDYALYGAYDDDNVYIGIQMLNITDSIIYTGSGSLLDGAGVGDVPIIVGIDTGATNKVTGKLATGAYIWTDSVGFDNGVDHVLYMSGKPGLGTPSIFTADENGYSDYSEHDTLFSTAGVTYAVSRENISSDIWGLDNSKAEISDILSGNNFVNYKTFTANEGTTHDTAIDTFYEIAIPYSALGITKSDVEKNGIGICTVATRGQSGLDCMPYDYDAMTDNITGDYTGGDTSTSAEKSDVDVITVDTAKLGASGGSSSDELELNFGADRSAPQTAGTALTLNGIAEGGTAGYTYKYYVNNSLVGTKTGSGATSVAWTPSAAGTYTIKCVVTDAAGTTVTSAKKYTVEGASSQSGWVQSGSNWYYYTNNVAATGWQKISSKWYYFNTSGVMQTGWQKISSKWYYFNASGVMQTGWKKISSKWYYFNASGVMQTGWVKISGSYYYFNTSGVMQSSTWVGNYYLTSTGAMAVSTWIGNYYVGADGAWVKNATK